MFRCLMAADFFLLASGGPFSKDGFLGKVIDEWTADCQEFLHSTLPRLIVIAAIAFLFNRLLTLISHRMVRLAEQHAAGPGRLGEVRTLAGVIHATGLAVIGVIAGFMILGAFGINLAPLLASAGVAGVAIGLAAQNIVKDMFNGFLILVEGQFTVGDTVRIAGLSGTVEAMTLRKTTVRDGDGTLYIVPNSQITTVANLSADFSVATVNVSVDLSADPEEVTKVLKEVAMAVRNSEEFKDVIFADPQVLGVDAVKGSQVIFPVVFKTRATQQYGPVREFQRRVRSALLDHGILPGDPNRVYGGPVTPPGRGEPAAVPARDPTTLKPQETNPFSGE